MFERLDQIEARYEDLTQRSASPDIVNDSARYQKTAKAHSEITPVVEKYREYKDLTKGIAESKAVFAEEKDPDMRAYAQEELDQACKAGLAQSKKISRFCCCPRIPTTRKTSSSKSALAPAATKPRCSRPRFSACTPVMPKCSGGKSKCSPLPSPRWAASRKSSRLSKAIECIRS